MYLTFEERRDAHVKMIIDTRQLKRLRRILKWQLHLFKQNPLQIKNGIA